MALEWNQAIRSKEDLNLCNFTFTTCTCILATNRNWKIMISRNHTMSFLQTGTLGCITAESQNCLNRQNGASIKNKFKMIFQEITVLVSVIYSVHVRWVNRMKFCPLQHFCSVPGNVWYLLWKWTKSVTWSEFFGEHWLEALLDWQTSLLFFLWKINKAKNSN